MFTKYPWAVVVGVLSYLIFFATFFLKISPFEWIRAPHEARELRMRVLDLEMQRRQQDLLLATLTARTPQADYLKPLKFEENWRDEHTRETIGRLVEYAEFALSKNDFEHAERFYTEASEMQPTITIPYYEGRLAYRRGDLQRAEVKWLEAIKRDPEGKYPDLRLYLGILYYQIGRASEAKQYFEYSVGHNAKP
ncbi:MAG: tetratricopeptide repeat protein [Candidatus Acidiferrales bacterium]